MVNKRFLLISYIFNNQLSHIPRTQVRKYTGRFNGGKSVRDKYSIKKAILHVRMRVT